MNNSFHFKAASIFLLLIIIAFPFPVNAGDVFVVCGSDSSVWSGVSYSRQEQYFPTNDPVFVSDSGNMTICMSDSYRNALRDSAGNPIKFTWWAHCGGIYQYSQTSSSIVSLELTLDYSIDGILKWGDEVSFHYHTWEWTDPDNDSVFHWNQAPNFLSTKDNFDRTLAQILIERQVWPATFRSGWNTMDNDWNNYLDTIIPYRMENSYPYVSFDDTEPVGSNYDWSHAVSDWIPYHPSSTDYQVPGDSFGWETRAEHVPWLDQTMINEIFATAAAGPDQVVVAWGHIAENFPSQITGLHNRIVIAQSNNPSVNFYYHTGIEAMQRWRGTTDTTLPELSFVLEKQGDLRTLIIHAYEELYQSKPFTAIKRDTGEYDTIDPVISSPNTWQVSYNRLLEPISKMGFGITDLAGNPASYVLELDTSGSDTIPAIQIMQPNFTINRGDKNFGITWSDYDPSGIGKISLYYDDDSIGYDGILIVDNISAYESADVFIWDTSSFAEGSYYIYGLLEDDIHPPVGSYSQAPVEILHGTDNLSPEPVTDLSAVEISPGEIEMTWSMPPTAGDGDLPVYYLIYGSQSSPVDLITDNLTGLIPAPSLSHIDIPMIAGDYYYVLIGVDDAGNFSTLSNIAQVNVTIKDVPPIAVDDLTCDDTEKGRILLSWTPPEEALDGEIPVSYKIYRSLTSPVDHNDEANMVGQTDTTFWWDYNSPLFETQFYIIIGVDDADHESGPSNEVNGARKSLHEISEVWRVDEGGFTTNSIRRIIYNKFTDHLLISDVDDDVIHIVEASDGSDTGQDLIAPAGGWEFFGPYGLTIDASGVIYCNQFWGNGNLYRWQDESSSPTIAADTNVIPDNLRGLFAIGSGTDTKVLCVGDDSKVDILTTDDGLIYEHSDEIDTSDLSARHGIWADDTGTEVLCTYLLAGATGIQKWKFIDSVWEKDVNFSPTIGGVDGIWQMPGDIVFTAHSVDNRVKILDASTGAIIGHSNDLGTGNISMDIFVDSVTNQVYWCRDGLGFGCLQYNTINEVSLWLLY